MGPPEPLFDHLDARAPLERSPRSGRVQLLWPHLARAGSGATANSTIKLLLVVPVAAGHKMKKPSRAEAADRPAGSAQFVKCVSKTVCCCCCRCCSPELSVGIRPECTASEGREASQQRQKQQPPKFFYALHRASRSSEEEHLREPAMLPLILAGRLLEIAGDSARDLCRSVSLRAPPWSLTMSVAVGSRGQRQAQ